MKLAEWELVNGSRSRDVGGEQITRHVVEPRVGNCLRSGGRYVFLVEQVKLPRICRMQRTNQSSSVICASPDRRPSSFDLPVLRLCPLRPNTTPVRPPLLEPEPWSILIRRPQSSMNDPQKSSIFTDIHECGTSSSTQHRTRLNQVWNR